MYILYLNTSTSFVTKMSDILKLNQVFSCIEDAKSAVKEYCQSKSNQKMQIIMEIEKNT